MNGRETQGRQTDSLAASWGTHSPVSSGALPVAALCTLTVAGPPPFRREHTPSAMHAGKCCLAYKLSKCGLWAEGHQPGGDTGQSLYLFGPQLPHL